MADTRTSLLPAITGANAAPDDLLYLVDTSETTGRNKKIVLSEVPEAIGLKAASGSSLVGADDGASGTLWTTIKGFITYLRSSLGASIVGYLPYGSGVPASTAHDSLRAIENEFGLLAAHDAFRKLETLTGGPFYVGITGYGDSMADPGNYTLGVIARSLQLRYGLGGFFTPGLGQTWNAAAWTFGGGATQPRTDYTYLPGANQVVMPVGSTAQTTTGAMSLASAYRDEGSFPREYSHNDSAVPATTRIRKVRCLYLTRPGDGSLTFTVSQVDATGYSPEVVSCNAALGLSYVDINVIDPTRPVTLHVGASTSGCLFVGAVFLRETGVLAWSSQVGGSTMEQQKTYINNGNAAGVYTQLCTALSTALFVHAQRVPGDANWQTNYQSVFTALASIAGTSQLVLGEPPRSVEETPTVPTINAWLSKECAIRGIPFFDQYRILGGSAVQMTALSWHGDGTHLAAPLHRFIAGKVLAAVNWFRMGGNKMDVDPLTMPQLLKRMSLLQALMSYSGSTIRGRASDTMDGTVTSGGYTFSAANDKGFVLANANAVGYVAGRPGLVSSNVNIQTPSMDVYTTFTGYRNLTLKAGLRAFGLIGVNATITTLVGLAQRCYGFEAALASDVGTPTGYAGTDEVMRLVSCDGTTTTYGPWVGVRPLGEAAPSQSGFNVMIGWNKDLGRLELWRGTGLSGVNLVSVLVTANHSTVNCTSAYISLALVGEDAGNVPVSGGNMSFSEIKTSWGATAWGIPLNGLMAIEV